MACKVKYNDDGSIRRVIDEKGNTSRLFQDIVNIPILQTAEEALETYKNRYSSKFMKEPKAIYAERNIDGESVYLLVNPDGTKEVVPKPENIELIPEEQVTEEMFKAEPQDEPTLIFKSDSGKLYSSYSEALSNSNGGNISVHMGSPSNESIMTVSSNTNPSTPQGFINYVLKNKLLSEKRLLDEGKLYFLPKGERDVAQVVNAAIIENEAAPNLGPTSIKIHRDRKIEIFDQKGKLTIGDKTYTFEEIDQMSFVDLAEEFGLEDAREIIINREVKKTYQPKKEVQTTLEYTEPELAQKFLDILNKMGVSVKSISDYVSSYKIRNGVEPSSVALADIANQVVAFKDGVIDITDLAEETAHFIVEAWNNSEIQNLLRNIHKTSQWKEHSNYYKDLYKNQGFEGTALDEMVRKEILGKVLADNLVENFSPENKTEIEQNIAQNILKFFREFIQKVSDFFTGENKTELDKFTDEVQKVLDSKDAENLLSTDTFAAKNFTMYKAGKPEPKVANLDAYISNLVDSLLDQEKALLKADLGLRSNVTKLRELQNKTADAMTSRGVLALIKSADRQVGYIKKAAERAKKDNNVLTNEENVVLNSIKNILKPTLEDISTILKKKNIPRKKDILESLDKTILGIGSVESEVRTTEVTILDGIVDRLIERQNLPEEYRERVAEALKAADKDTSAFYATFGQLTSAHDVLLNITGALIAETTLESKMSYTQRSKKFIQTLEKLGLKPKDLKQFYDKDGFILSQYDWPAFDKQIKQIEAQALKDATGTDFSVEKIMEMKRNPKKYPKESLPQLETDEQRLQYSRDIRDKKAPLVESLFNEQYYKDKQDKYDTYNISKEAQRELGYLSLDRGTLMSRVKMKNGYPRYTSQDKTDLQAIAQKRKSLKNIKDDLGNNREGLIVVKTNRPDEVNPNTPNTFVSNGYLYMLKDKSSEEAKIAFDINKLDTLFQLQEGSGQLDFEGLSENFMKQLQLIEENEGREEALEFFRLNATISFSQNFWDSLGETESFEDRVKSYLATKPDDLDEVAFLYEKFSEASEKRKAILKNFKDPKDVSNILAENMYSETKEQVQQLTESIETFYRQIFAKLPEVESDVEKRDAIAERSLNQSYYDYLRDNNIEYFDKKENKYKTKIEEEYEFAIKHVPPRKRGEVELLKSIVDSVFSKEGSVKNISSKYQEIIVNLYPGEGTTIGSLTEEQIKRAPIMLARKNIAPYYKAFAPKGYRNIYERLTNDKSNEKISDIVREIDANPNMKVTNDFAYYDTDINKYKNPKFKEESDSGRYQPKLDLFRNKRFEDMFQPTYDEKGDIVSVGKNQKLYEGYKAMLDFQRENLKSINEDGNVNLFQAPQISRTNLDKIFNFVNKKGKRKTAKEFFRDIVSYRTDELAEGVEKDGKSVYKMTGMRFIPKYYISPLEEPSDVTDDLFYSMVTMAQQSELYKARKKHYTDFMAIEQALLADRYPDGKPAESTNTMKMFRSYIDNNLFGIIEQTTMKVNLPVLGQVDVAKVARQLHKWLRLRNLGLSFIIPLTSWVTGEVTYAVETLIGDYVNRQSTGRARREMRKHSIDAIKETGEVNSKARLNLIGEHYDFFDYADRYRDSKFGKLFRNFPKIAMFTHTAFNFPINTRVALNALIDHRFVDGDIVNYNEFKANNKDLNNKQLKAKWKTYETDTFYDAIDTSEGMVKFDYDTIAKKLGRENNEEFQEWFKNKEQGIAARTLKIIERVDTQIRPEERSAATRHFILNFFTTHRNYLWLQFAYRFKNRHTNIQTGRAEEGTYRSLANFITRNLNKGMQNKFKGFFKQVKEDYQNAENQVERDNIKRTLIEVGALQVLAGIGFLISAMADDEDNKDIYGLQLTAYEMDRVVKEMTSAYTGTIPEFFDAVKSPIIGMDFLKDVFTMHKVFDTENIEYGKYQGMSKGARHTLKLVPGVKNIHSIWDADNIRATRNIYRLHNQDAVDTMNIIYYLLNSE